MRAGALVFAGVLLAVITPRAEAGLTLCNRTSYVLYAATAASHFPAVEIKGWTRLIPGACVEAIKGDLTADNYYLYAKTSRAHAGAPHAWSGTTQLCAKDKDFTTRGSMTARCSGDFSEFGFAEIATGHARSWTTTIHEAPDLPNAAAAERAGLKRLITDTGARNIFTDKQADSALAAFRARLHLAANAPASALFDALETEAMKAASPTGYTLCNETPKEVYAAIGLQMVGPKGPVFAARGWWTVAAGACSPLMTESIAGKKVWLRVERGKNQAAIEGPTKFCVTNIAFDIQGRDRCAARGLAEVGFAETAGGPAPGFTAHVTATGLGK